MFSIFADFADFLVATDGCCLLEQQGRVQEQIEGTGCCQVSSAAVVCLACVLVASLECHAVLHGSVSQEILRHLTILDMLLRSRSQPNRDTSSSSLASRDMTFLKSEEGSSIYHVTMSYS